MPASRTRRRSNLRGSRLTVVVVLLASVVIVVWPSLRRRHGPVTPRCTVTVGTASYRLTGEQAENAATIAVVGVDLGLPDHAVTVALATALQESGLRNLPYGDRDSLGLFQQRPSQGWGTRSEVTTPRIAAQRFYEHLARVPGWRTMAVTDAAQRVQFSAAPQAYARWETEARAIAVALTGEEPAGLACRFQPPLRPTTVATTGPALRSALAAELGGPGPGAVVNTARGWVVASWLVAFAHRYDVGTVSFDGRRWTAASGGWAADPGADNRVRY